MAFAGDCPAAGFVYRGRRIADARFFASLPRRRFRRPVRGARMSSAANARLIISNDIEGSGDGGVDMVTSLCDRGGGWGRAGVSIGVKCPLKLLWLLALNECAEKLRSEWKLIAEDAAAVLGVGSSSPLTSTVGVIRRTGLPMFCGTCKLKRCLCVPPALIIGDSPVEGGSADAGVGGKRKTCSGGGDFECDCSAMGVSAVRCRCWSPWAPSLLGLTGKVTKGPSLVERLLGGRPRGFPPGVVPLADQADETAGPWRRRARGLALDGVTAD